MESSRITIADLWKEENQVDEKDFSEQTMLLYFDNLKDKYKPSTLWVFYSSLRTCIQGSENVDINYPKVNSFLKKISVGYRAKQSIPFQPDELRKFLYEAPDEDFLVTKVIMIFGIYGATRADALTRIDIRHIKAQGDVFVIKIPQVKGNYMRTFTLEDDYAEYVRKYQNLRPPAISTSRFFIGYQKGKCSNQPIGRNKFLCAPKAIAKFLNLPDPEQYTGYSFRRTSPALLAYVAGEEVQTLKSHDEWRPASGSKGCVQGTATNSLWQSPSPADGHVQYSIMSQDWRSPSDAEEYDQKPILSDLWRPTNDAVVSDQDSNMSQIWRAASDTEEYEQKPLLIELASKRKFVSIQSEALSQWKKKFNADPKNILAQNVCAQNDAFEVCVSRRQMQNTQHVFTHKIELEGKPVTHQKSSSRCWIFAALNCARIPFMKSLNIEDFEFSQAHLFYWDKIERANNSLNNIVETVTRGEDVSGRLISFLLKNPIDEGGQWAMLINLINKYGLMPKKYFPETFCCESSLRFNIALRSKLREYAQILRTLIAEGADAETIKGRINSQMSEIYNIVGICVGIPQETFKWEYYDKSKKYHAEGPMTPLAFYEKFVKQYFNFEDRLCLMSDPRPTSPYGEMYTVNYLNNVVDGSPVLYNNQPIELLMDLVVKSIKKGEPVWFGCDVGKRMAAKYGIGDLEIHDFKLLFGVDIRTPLCKSDRLLYGESSMTHSMVFTAVTLDENGKPTKFRVENSWGEDRGEKGYIVMTAEWFKEFVFEVVIDKDFLPADVLDVFKKSPIVLPAWDPMGTLAM